MEEDGRYKKQSRGKTKGVLGEWRERTRKHRFVMQFDKTLEIKWVEQKWKNNKSLGENGTTTNT